MVVRVLISIKEDNVNHWNNYINNMYYNDDKRWFV